ncbi:hypothetical protein EDB81DRAFT_832649 [Dactylonectria macrodidyma]|uniref:Uncharacterized protein n=1 Tax=Dactylonectria macrodidyma TaxID=307937 RepID=A0A9P9D056_9HYPO|nr:hypothetical protein EDB81DRAFT_832649 [Dactylonectria macrodidyma]
MTFNAMKRSRCMEDVGGFDERANEAPFYEAKKKWVFFWTCCLCGSAGMNISVDPCRNCGIKRCPNCITEKLVI